MSVTVHHGDCLDVLRGMAEASVDSVVCDPPYHLTNRTPDVKWCVDCSRVLGGSDGKPTACPRCGGALEYQRSRGQRGFMGKKWDGGDVAFRPETWAEVLRVMKPGAHLVAFGGTRTYHRMVCAIEDAGFEVRDQLAWVYGTGFPKSLDVGKAIDRAAGAERVEIVGSKLGRPGMARDGGNQRNGFDHAFGGEKSAAPMDHNVYAPATPEAAKWQGWGTALKPAWEPIVLARKPLACPTVAAQVLATGTGALNIDGCRVPTDESTVRTICGGGTNTEQWRTGRGNLTTGGAAGRWPANLCHDGSPEVLDAFAAFGSDKGQGLRRSGNARKGERVTFGMGAVDTRMASGDTGSAARFFPAFGFGEDELRFHYSAKASRADRCGSKHPTVKPVALMRWLCRLVTPPGGVCLDCFAGTGVTGEACLREGFSAVLIEREFEYYNDIMARLARHRGEAPPPAEVAA